MPKIRRALLSVYDKRGIVPFAKGLVRRDVKILSTGKTARLLRRNGIPVQDVSDYTGYPELLDGQVKTLHPKIHAAILADRKNRSHMKALRTHGIEPIDLVAADLYPFEGSLGKGRKESSELLELIDIGGVTLLRAAAKNYRFVTVVPGAAFYDKVLEALKKNASIGEETNRRLAYQAFLRTSRYDRAIRNFFGEGKEETFPEHLDIHFRRKQALRYGENPHQQAALYVDAASDVVMGELSLQGKVLSFNNLLDLDSAYRIVSEFKKSAVAIVKHASPCGVSLGRTIEEAFGEAWACDPESAFGGVVAVNRTVSTALAKKMVESGGFLEVVGFPGIEKGALKILSRKTHLRLVPFGTLYTDRRRYDIRRISENTLLVQTEDDTVVTPSQLKGVTHRRPTRKELASLLFAFTVAKHVRSNAIVIAEGESTVGIGGGQPSRVGAVRLAVGKAGVRAADAVLASDGFFPFADNVEVAAGAGIRAIIQPGGSIRDHEVIDACNRYGIAMVFSGIRHFRH